MPAPRRRIPAARRRWSGAGGDPRPDTFAPLPLDIATLSLGFFSLFFFFASLELNDISSSAGAAGRLEIAQREAWKGSKGSSWLCGKGEGVLLENPFFSWEIPWVSLCRRVLAGGWEKGKQTVLVVQLESLGSGVFGGWRCPSGAQVQSRSSRLSPAWKNPWAVFRALQNILLLLWDFAKKLCKGWILSVGIGASRVLPLL